MADEILHRMQRIQDTGRASVVGGRKRQIKVLLEPEKMASRLVAVLDIERGSQRSQCQRPAGTMDVLNQEIVVDAGPFIKSTEEVDELVIGVHEGKPVYSRDVARVVDGPEEVTTYTRLTLGPAVARDPETKQVNGEQGKSYNQVTIAVAKRKGTNAVRVAEGLIEQIKDLQKSVIPSDVNILVTRNYGKTADEKVNELVKHLGIAVVSIVALLTVILGWREAMIVALAVPMTLAVTLLANLLVGYTINRVTLFLLILSLGLLVDDPIVDVENIHRHFRLKTHPPLDATLLAVDEVTAPDHIGNSGGDRLIYPALLHYRDDGAIYAPDGAERAHCHDHVSGDCVHCHSLDHLSRTEEGVRQGREALRFQVRRSLSHIQQNNHPVSGEPQKELSLFRGNCGGISAFHVARGGEAGPG